MAKNKIIYDIGFNVEKDNLKQAQEELRKLYSITESDFKHIIDPDITTKDFKAVQQQAKQLSEILQDSFNPKLNTINLDTFNRKIKENNVNTNQLGQAFTRAGESGQRAFRNVTATLLTTEREAKKAYKVFDKLSESLANTIRWKITSGGLDTITSGIQKAWNFTKKLDASLNDIRVVTGQSAEQMDKFAKKANEAARALGGVTTDYTKAALIYYQQGLGDIDVEARTQATIKAANVTGQSASEVSEQLTAVWNGYKVVANEAEKYVDKLAAVAATTAADLEELSDGMSKVASAANTMGINVDQLAAQLSTIVSVTRQDASAVGTALKTIYARMGDLEVDGVDEFGTTLGDVSGKLQQMGIDVTDQMGNLRDMGSVIEEVAAKWGAWTKAQQQAAAVAIAGKRQYNNLIALFENWDMYESALATSQNSAGTLDEQNKIYLDSLEARLNRLATAGEKVYSALFDSSSMKDAIDLASSLVETFGELVETIGGGGNLLLMFGSLAGKTIGKQFGSFAATSLENIQNLRYNALQERAELETIDFLRNTNMKVSEEQVKELIALREKQLRVEHLLTEEEKKRNLEQMKGLAQAQEEANKVEEKYTDVLSVFKDSFGFDIGEEDNISTRDQNNNTKEIDKYKKNIGNQIATENDYNNVIAVLGKSKQGAIDKLIAENQKIDNDLSKLGEQKKRLKLSTSDVEFNNWKELEKSRIALKQGELDNFTNYIIKPIKEIEARYKKPEQQGQKQQEIDKVLWNAYRSNPQWVGSILPPGKSDTSLANLTSIASKMTSDLDGMRNSLAQTETSRKQALALEEKSIKIEEDRLNASKAANKAKIKEFGSMSEAEYATNNNGLQFKVNENQTDPNEYLQKLADRIDENNQIRFNLRDQIIAKEEENLSTNNPIEVLKRNVAFSQNIQANTNSKSFSSDQAKNLFGALTSKDIAMQSSYFKGAIENLNSSYEDWDAILYKVSAGVQLTAQESEKLDKILHSLNSAAKESIEETSTVIKQLQEIKDEQEKTILEAAKRSQEALEQLQRDAFRLTVNTISELVGSVTSLVAIFTSISNTFKNIAQDENLSFWEKIGKIIATIVPLLLTALPTLISSATNLTKGVQNLAKTWGEVAAAATAAKVAQKAAMDVKTKNAEKVAQKVGEEVAENVGKEVAEKAIKKAGEEAVEIVTEKSGEGVLDNLVESLMSTILGGGPIATIGIKVLQKLNSKNKTKDVSKTEKKNPKLGSTTTEGASSSAVTPIKEAVKEAEKLSEKVPETLDKTSKAVKGSGGKVINALKGLFTKLGALIKSFTAFLSANPIIAIIMGIIAALALLVTGIVHVVKAMQQKADFNKAQQSFKNLSKAATEAKEKLTDLKNEYSNLVSEFSKIRDAKTALDDLRVGTTEWQQAVEELNNSVEELIVKYPELADEVEKNEQGFYEIDEAAYSKIIAAKTDAIASQKLVIASLNFAQAQAKENLDRLSINKETLSTVKNAAEGRKVKIKGNDFDEDLKLTYRTKHRDRQKEKENQQLENFAKQYDAVEWQTKGLRDSLVFDVEKLKQMDTVELISLQNSIDSLTNIDKEVREQYKDYIQTIIDNSKSLQESTKATEAMKKAYLAAIGNDQNIDGDIYANVTTHTGTGESDKKIYSMQDLRLVKQNGSVRTGMGAGYRSLDGEREYRTSGNIDTWLSNNDEKALAWIVDSVKLTFPDAKKIEYPNKKELKGLTVDELENVKVTVDGQEYTMGEVVIKYYSDQQAQDIATKTEATTNKMTALSSQGRMQEAVYYASDVVGENYYSWEGATLDKLSTIAGYGEEYEANANKASNVLSTNLREIFGLEKNVDVSKYSKLTESQAKQLTVDIGAAAAIEGVGSENSIIQQLVDSISDPTQIAKIQELLSNVNWTDPQSINEFYLGLMEAGIVISDKLAPTWNTFMSNVNSGMKKWISNAQQVAESLAYIRDTVSAINMGDLISDEEYAKMLKINPEVAKYFVKTAGGMVAIANGKEIASTLKGSYKDLGEIQSFYSGITSAVGTSKGDAYLKEEDLASWGQINELITGNSNFIAIAKALGLGSETSISELITKAGSGDSGAIAALQDIALAVNQAQLDVENGVYDASSAQQVYGTSVASSWTEANKKIGDSWVDTATKNKVLDYWTTTYLSELGLSLQNSLIEAFDETDMSKLEEVVATFRQLELDYFKEYERELNQINISAERAIGKSKQTLLNQAVSTEKDSYQLAQGQFTAAKTNFAYMIEASEFKDYYENGTLNYTGLLDLIASDPEKAEAAQEWLNMWDKVLAAEDKAIEANDKIIDRQIESFKYQYERQKELVALFREWRDFANDFNFSSLGDFKDESLEKNISKSFGAYEDAIQDWGLIKDKLGNYEKWKAGDASDNNPFFTNGVFDSAKFNDAWKEDLNSAKTYLTEMKEALNSLYDNYLSAQAELMELYDKEREKLNGINSILEKSANLAKLAGNATRNYYQQMANNATQSAEFAKMQLAVAQAEYDKVLALGDNASEEMLETTRANLQKAAETVLDSTQVQMDAIAQQFSISLQETLDAFVGGSLEGISEEWSLATKMDDRYLDDVNSAYAESKLTKGFQKSIDEIDSISAKNKLLQKQAAIEESLAKIKEKQGKLTQADLDRANAEYELTLKQIALEEAQQNKTQMKLTRDASGNYSYQYVADQDEIAKAEEELAEAENKLYNMEKDRTKKLVEEYYSTMSEANTAISEAVAAGDEERVARLTQYYEKLLTGIQAELNTSSNAFERLGGEIENWQTPFTNFTSAIEALDITDLFGKDGSITEMINGLFGENGSIITLQSDINAMLSEGSPLYTATSKLKEAVLDQSTLVTETANLMTATQLIVDKLPDSIADTKILANKLLEVADIYKSWIKELNPDSDLSKLTKEQISATREQTQATLELIDAMDKEKDGKINGIEIKVNGWEYKDNEWSVVMNDTSGAE